MTDDEPSEADPEPDADPADGPEGDTAGESGVTGQVVTRLAALGLVLVVVQAAVFTALLTAPVGALPTGTGTALFGACLLGAAVFGVDAYRTDLPGWSPNPFLWAAPMVLPLTGLVWGLGVPVGVAAAYVARRYERVRGTPGDPWFLPAVVAGGVSGLGLLVGLAGLTGTAPFPVAPTLVFVVSTALLGFTTPATFYDVRRVQTRRVDGGDDWLLGGYHWVFAMSVPHPLRSLVAVVYAVRRRGLFGAGPAVADDNA